MTLGLRISVQPVKASRLPTRALRQRRPLSLENSSHKALQINDSANPPTIPEYLATTYRYKRPPGRALAALLALLLAVFWTVGLSSGFPLPRESDSNNLSSSPLHLEERALSCSSSEVTIPRLLSTRVSLDYNSSEGLAGFARTAKLSFTLVSNFRDTSARIYIGDSDSQGCGAAPSMNSIS